MTPTSTDERGRRRAEVPAGLRDARISELEEQLGARDARIAVDGARIAELEALVAKLTAQVEELTEKLGQDSTNSHRPPSSDGPGAAGRRKAEDGRNKRKKSKRKRGGQKGHRGAHRALVPPEQVHEFVDLFAPSCRGCGKSLPEVPDCDARRHQVIDLVPYAPHIKEFRRHAVELTLPRFPGPVNLTGSRRTYAPQEETAQSLQ